MINAKPSPLKLNEYAILRSKCMFVPSEDSTINCTEKMASYPIQIDFGISKDSEDGIYRIVSKIAINYSEEKQLDSGYSIFVECAGFFSFEPSANYSEETKIGMLQMSGISICITNMRSYIANMTSFFPFGKYNFPSIDINALLHDKAEQVINKQNQ